jgi:protein CpxP
VNHASEEGEAVRRDRGGAAARRRDGRLLRRRPRQDVAGADEDATSAQRKVVLDQTYKVLADAQKLHAQSAGDHEKLLAELESSQPRAAVIHAMVDERMDGFKAFLHRSVDALLVANAALSVDQREQLGDMARERMNKE